MVISMTDLTALRWFRDRSNPDFTNAPTGAQRANLLLRGLLRTGAHGLELSAAGREALEQEAVCEVSGEATESCDHLDDLSDVDLGGESGSIVVDLLTVTAILLGAALCCWAPVLSFGR